MKYLIGIDGGGTKTKCIVADLNLKPIYECTSGSSNLLINDFQTVAITISKLLEKCKKNIYSDYKSIASIVLGTAGAGRKRDAKNFENKFLSYIKDEGITLQQFKVESDARIALEGAFSGKPGGILISGTGSIMFGKDSKGNIHRVGGFGRFIGDEGSGYSIGRKGLSALSKFYDGRGKATLLSKLVSKQYKISNEEKLITAVYSQHLDIASVARQVLYAAMKGDPVCIKILEEEANELILHIIALKKKLKQSSFNIALFGSVIANDNYFSKIFLNKIKERLPEINVIDPEHSPAMGAVLMSKKLLRQSHE
jgi:N-acetylglucosamine kinase-like BadF-type ATPase